MSGADTIFTPFSPAHIWNVLLVFTVCSRFRAILLHFPCIPFPGLLLPPHPGRFTASCCMARTEKVGRPSKNRMERGNQRRHLQAVIHLRSERLMCFFKHVFVTEESDGPHLNQGTTLNITNLLRSCKMKNKASPVNDTYQKCLTGI